MAEPLLVVMAAGIGSRYGGLKQIEPVGPSGEIIVDYAVYDAIKAGFKKVVFIIREEIEEDFLEVVGDAVARHVETVYAYQELDKLPAGLALPEDRTKPWGTAHALYCAKGVVDQPFAAINADDYYGPGAFQVLYDHLKAAKDTNGVYDYSMVGYVLKNTLTEYGHVARGVCTATADECLASVVERTKIKKFDDRVKYTEDDENWVEISGDSVVSMNMWGFTPGLLDEFETRFRTFFETRVDNPKAEYYLPTLVNDLIHEGRARVKVLHSDERWFGVTYREDKPIVEKFIREKTDQGIYPESLWG